VELEKIVEVAKKLGAGSVKYVKYSYVPATSTYHVKIYLVKPLEWRALAELVKELEKELLREDIRAARPRVAA